MPASSTVTSEPEGAHDSIWSGAYVQVSLAILTVVAIAAFDGLAIVAALPDIAHDLGNIGLLPWVITAYLASSAVAVIVAGPVIDAVGVRKTFRVSGLWFLVASAAAAFAPTMPLLIVARAVQGLGGGLVIAVALAAVGISYPHELRPRAFAANALVWGVMGFGGPAIAGALLTTGDWRSIFLVHLPLTALALAIGWRALPSTERRPIAVDWTGVTWLALLTSASLVAVSEIGARWWLVAIGVVVTAVSSTAYWRHSGRIASPVLAREHLTRFPLGAVHLTSGLVLVAGLTADNYLPLYVQTVRGRSEGFAAFSLVFLTVGWTIGSVVFSRALSTWREVDVISVGAKVLVPAIAVAGGAVALGWPLAVIFAGFACVGFSIGLVSTAGLTLLQSASAPGEMGRTNSAHQFVRTLCITYGVAIGGAILLLVVDRRVGDVEAVRDLLAGDEAVVVDVETIDAIAVGLASTALFAVVAGLGCLAAARSLRRRADADAAATDDKI